MPLLGSGPQKKIRSQLIGVLRGTSISATRIDPASDHSRSRSTESSTHSNSAVIERLRGMEHTTHQQVTRRQFTQLLEVSVLTIGCGCTSAGAIAASSHGHSENGCGGDCCQRCKKSTPQLRKQSTLVAAASTVSPNRCLLHKRTENIQRPDGECSVT